MKFVMVLFGMSSCVMVVIILQAARQDVSLRSLRSAMEAKSAEIEAKENNVMEVKNKIKELKSSITAISVKMDVLKRKKEDLQKSVIFLNTNLQACNKDKDADTKTNTDNTETLNKIKADHEAKGALLKQEIQKLKQQILDRDKAICVFVDTANEEGRKLCGNL